MSVANVITDIGADTRRYAQITIIVIHREPGTG